MTGKLLAPLFGSFVLCNSPPVSGQVPTPKPATAQHAAPKAVGSPTWSARSTRIRRSHRHQTPQAV